MPQVAKSDHLSGDTTNGGQAFGCMQNRSGVMASRFGKRLFISMFEQQTFAEIHNLCDVWLETVAIFDYCLPHFPSAHSNPHCSNTCIFSGAFLCYLKLQSCSSLSHVVLPGTRVLFHCGAMTRKK